MPEDLANSPIDRAFQIPIRAGRKDVRMTAENIVQTAGTAANLRRVWTRMGTPSSSLNCLLGDFLLDFAVEGEAMRVPSPAAWLMTKTFIRAKSIGQRRWLRVLQFGPSAYQS